MTNLSVGGFYVQTKELLPVGSSVDAEITVEGKKVTSTAEVRHQQRVANEVGMGLKFVRVDPTLLAVAQRLVEAHLSSQVASPP